MILVKSTRNKIFLEILEDYKGVGLKNFQLIEQKLEICFWPNFPLFREFR